VAEPARQVCCRRFSQPSKARWRPTRSILLAALSVLLALPLVAVGPIAPAQAQDSPAEIEAKIDAAWRELEPVIEEHNRVRIELDEKRDEIEELEEKIEPLQLKVDMARSEVVDVAVYNFKQGNVSAFNALLSTGSPLTFADQLSALDQFARSQRMKIEKVLRVKEEYETEKAALDELVADLEEMERELGERADEIDAEIDRLQELRTAAYGSSGGGSGSLAPSACPATYPGGPAGEAINFACAQIGKPYGWGSSGPNSYDCSGLVLAAWSQAGVSLPHNAASQRNAVRYVDRSELQPGDLVFYYGGLSHVGLYAGDGWIVHAPQAGDVVRMDPIDKMPVHSYGRP
jgi:cell wall-associated NlpC family hydrolase